MSVVALPFEKVFEDASSGNLKVQKGDYVAVGRHPIVDQGQEFIGGYTDDSAYLVKGKGPWIIFGDHTRALKFVDFRFCMGADGVKVLKPKSEIGADPRFLYHFLVANEIPSAGYSRHYKFLKRLEIPLPPLPEQRRIAAILDKTDALRRKRKRAIELLDSLTQSIFLEMFGDPNINPRNLPKIALGDLVKVKSGNGLVAKDMDENGSFPVYGGNGINGHHSSYMFEEPMIVLGRVGVYCGAVHVTQPHSWVTDNALYVSEIKRSTSLRYLADALRFADLNQYAGRAAQPLISGSRIYPVEVLFPPLELQRTYERAIASSRSMETLLFDSRERLEALFSSLQSRAFSGQL
ncbi:restriction endonuclease subunit S [Mesorhizobium sp. CA5]|uniref:restriction endonuclease subunit S n=1 Tax=Mesorhizobium sp. CA5 TaxID=2876638 RepID=UPI001CD18CDB|nr:restriction endonuclease subunit S [Mesorhizobium sp. CA5]MBZ9842196.1 restriction endonuclease subunit S [Mesorhizobium sp. CA5]